MGLYEAVTIGGPAFYRFAGHRFAGHRFAGRRRTGRLDIFTKVILTSKLNPGNIYQSTQSMRNR
ncbi:hypothetical protein CFter6_3070 [Collimonas fungivorans]|uniref:Uncharacterized protein n=1 Tax=Collimonas fungivorans TaxID=158899 RepID=A0A127PD45_9BURK|nr:hypothetical protein CFter6_3070 [Collimonas fungivorans]